MPKISVIVPVYKAKEYLHSCIDSILSQTFSDFEVILVDDGSPDSSGAICEEYARRDSRVSVIHQTNQGQAAARNHALAQAKGEWVCFVDSDDLIHPQMLELLYRAATESSAGISMCEMLEASRLPEDFSLPCDGGFEAAEMDEATLVKLYDAGAYPSWVACAKLIRREIVETHLFREGRVFEDNEAVCHWVCTAKTVARMPHKLYFYRTNPGSTTQSNFSLKKLDYLWALENIIRFYGSLGYGELRQRFLARYIDAAINVCYGARDVLGRPDVAKETEKRVKTFLRREQTSLTKEQFESLLDAAHPRLIRFYWPVEGCIRTVREQGVLGIVRKVSAQLRKGERE